MTTIYLIRHAESEGNLFKRIQGQYDCPITALGQQQIACLKSHFAQIPVDAIYSSDLRRALQTAQAIYLPKHLPLHTDPALREVDFGAWEDVPFGAAMNCNPDCMKRFQQGELAWHIEGGETLLQAQERIVSCVQRIVAENPNRTVAIVSHGTVIRLLLTKLSASGHYQPEGMNTSFSCLQADINGIHIQWVNRADHLTGNVIRKTFQPKQPIQTVGVPEELLWFRPWNSKLEEQLYLSWRAEAWMSSHGTMAHYHGDAFLEAVRKHSSYDSSAVQIVLSNGNPAGLIEMDFEAYAKDMIGFIPFYYVDSAHRKQGLGIQLLGQAISTFRKMGRTKLRLRCAPENETAYRFYCRHGFQKIGMAQDSVIPLYLMERKI